MTLIPFVVCKSVFQIELRDYWDVRTLYCVLQPDDTSLSKGQHASLRCQGSVGEDRIATDKTTQTPSGRAGGGRRLENISYSFLRTQAHVPKCWKCLDLAWHILQAVILRPYVTHAESFKSAGDSCEGQTALMSPAPPVWKGLWPTSTSFTLNFFEYPHSTQLHFSRIGHICDPGKGVSLGRRIEWPN